LVRGSGENEGKITDIPEPPKPTTKMPFFLKGMIRRPERGGVNGSQ
jgi:hypothetical protein